MDHVAVGKQNSPLDRVLELTHISGPVVGHQEIDRRCRKPGDGAPVTAVVPSMK
jgi:hypothetical protein